MSPALTERANTGTRETSDESSNPSCSWDKWGVLVAQIKAGEETGMEHLYRLFSRGIRYYLCRHIGPQELDDRVHDTFLIVVKAIQHGDLREPERLMGFVRTVVHRQVAGYIEKAVHTRRDHTDIETGITVADRNQNPEQQAMAKEKAGLVKTALESLSPRNREILVRYYLKEQSREQICREMSLTETQFRLTKSRAKTKFGEIGRKKLAPTGVCDVLVRAHAS